MAEIRRRQAPELGVSTGEWRGRRQRLTHRRSGPCAAPGSLAPRCQTRREPKAGRGISAAGCEWRRQRKRVLPPRAAARRGPRPSPQRGRPLRGPGHRGACLRTKSLEVAARAVRHACPCPVCTRGTPDECWHPHGQGWLDRRAKVAGSIASSSQGPESRVKKRTEPCFAASPALHSCRRGRRPLISQAKNTTSPWPLSARLGVAWQHLNVP